MGFYIRLDKLSVIGSCRQGTLSSGLVADIVTEIDVYQRLVTGQQVYWWCRQSKSTRRWTCLTPPPPHMIWQFCQRDGDFAASRIPAEEGRRNGFRHGMGDMIPP